MRSVRSSKSASWTRGNHGRLRHEVFKASAIGPNTQESRCGKSIQIIFTGLTLIMLILVFMGFPHSEFRGLINGPHTSFDMLPDRSGLTHDDTSIDSTTHLLDTRRKCRKYADIPVHINA